MVRNKPYYSIRTGKNPLSVGFDLEGLRELFKHQFVSLEDEGYFQEALGFECVDAGFIAGTIGQNLEDALLIELRKRGLTPIRHKIEEYSEDDLFDIIEFLYEHCSKPVERQWHSWNECGWHCDTFDKNLGRSEYRDKINKVLALYDKGYELSEDGEILTLPDDGLGSLFEAGLPRADPQNVVARVAAAQTKYRRYRSSMAERRDAVRDLADVLEYLRPKLKRVLTNKDEAALFEIANNFGIRHHNAAQTTDYDKPIWYSWMFYFYLATIHASVRLIERANKQGAA
jgi:hypothetical protein